MNDTPYAEALATSRDRTAPAVARAIACHVVARLSGISIEAAIELSEE